MDHSEHESSSASGMDLLASAIDRLGDVVRDEAFARHRSDEAVAAERRARAEATFGSHTQLPDGSWAPPAVEVEEPETLLVVTSRRLGGAHVVATGPFAAGRIQRERGEPLCEPGRRFTRLRGVAGRTMADVTCRRCHRVVERLDVAHLLQPPARAPDGLLTLLEVESSQREPEAATVEELHTLYLLTLRVADTLFDIFDVMKREHADLGVPISREDLRGQHEPDAGAAQVDGIAFEMVGSFPCRVWTRWGVLRIAGGGISFWRDEAREEFLRRLTLAFDAVREAFSETGVDDLFAVRRVDGHVVAPFRVLPSDQRRMPEQLVSEWRSAAAGFEPCEACGGVVSHRTGCRRSST